MIATNPQELYGLEVRTADGSKVGKVEEVYIDNASGQPEWAEVKTGLFGHRTSLVPLAPADHSDGTLTVPFDKERVKAAPQHEPGQALAPEQEAHLFDYYGVPYQGEDGTVERKAVEPEAAVGQVVPPPAEGDTGDR